MGTERAARRALDREPAGRCTPNHLRQCPSRRTARSGRCGVPRQVWRFSAHPLSRAECASHGHAAFTARQKGKLSSFHKTERHDARTAALDLAGHPQQVRPHAVGATWGIYPARVRVLKGAHGEHFADMVPLSLVVLKSRDEWTARHRLNLSAATTCSSGSAASIKASRSGPAGAREVIGWWCWDKGTIRFRDTTTEPRSSLSTFGTSSSTVTCPLISSTSDARRSSSAAPTPPATSR